MWVKQCHKLPMSGNGKHTINMVIWGMVYCFAHVRHNQKLWKSYGKTMGNPQEILHKFVNFMVKQ